MLSPPVDDAGLISPIAPDTRPSHDGVESVAGRVADRRQRVKLAAAGFGSFLATLAWFGIREVSLAYDDRYRATLFLMWPREDLGGIAVQFVLLSLDLLCPVVAMALLAGALLPSSVLQRPPAILRGAYRYALVLPVIALITTSLARFVSNGIYALAGHVTWDFTAILARLEAPLLRAFQEAAFDHSAVHAAAAIYAGGWMLALLAVPPLFMLFGRHAGVARLAAGWVLAAVLAVPMFLLLPVFEPWTLNPVYGYAGASPAELRFLAIGAPHAAMTYILEHHRWAAGACLPSLHVAMPVVVGAICFQQRLRWLGWMFVGLAAAVSVSVVYLGRHWMVDVAVGIGFGLAIARLTVRLRPERFLLLPDLERSR